MKKLSLFFAAFLLANSLSAKKVKFAVNMGTNTISALGIHVMGDFQTIAGFSGGDFNAGTTLCTQEGTTTIYSIIVTLPAFQKYEFKFVNGDQSYEAEFVPEKARVGYNFNDNRWIYVDSLGNDTSSVGAVMFGGTSPAGQTLVRFMVDMQNVTVNPNDPHVAGNFQGNDPAKTRLYSFGNNIYEIISYMNTGAIQFKYYNGKIAANTETVPGTCATSGNRTHTVMADSILTTVCFSECNACIPNSLQTQQIQFQSLKIYPNPTNEAVSISTPEKGKVVIVDLTGKLIYEENVTDQHTLINVSLLSKGYYQIYYQTSLFIFHNKLIIEN